uniref:non-specific serine/threonine protein kinase n=1 Tax=Hucho hucho TaxID=62062 RepID=A0A4W5PZV1_9TELE
MLPLGSVLLLDHPLYFPVSPAFCPPLCLPPLFLLSPSLSPLSALSSFPVLSLSLCDLPGPPDHLALIIELLGKVPRHYALSGKFSQEYFTKRDHIALIIELLGQVPRKLITAGKYSKDFFTKKGKVVK